MENHTDDPLLTLTPEELGEVLLRTADGSAGPRAAGTELLVRHGWWLASTFFVLDCVGSWRTESDAVGARVLWGRVGARLADPEAIATWHASASDLAVLEIAAALAAGDGDALQELTRVLDADAAALVAAVVADTPQP